MTASSKPPPGKPAGTYSRFIPREELGSFAAWNPDALSDDAAAGVDSDASASAAEAAADTPAPHAQVAAARQAGYQDGYRDGLVALDSFKASFARQMHTQLGGLLAAFGEQIDALERDMAQAVAESAVLLARRVVCAELHTHPASVAQVAQQAVNAVLLTARHIRVQVHPDDHELVAEGAAEVLQARGARLLPNPAVARGGCLIESDLGQIDARIESRWRQAALVLGSELPWNADANAAADGADDT
jgi:flagellar assembly protein FliH